MQKDFHQELNPTAGRWVRKGKLTIMFQERLVSEEVMHVCKNVKVALGPH